MTRRLAILLFGIGLLWPVCWLTINSLSLTSVYEEAIGYRYFYTLRQLYEGSTYLFLPQGQSVNLIFKLLHLAFSQIGLSPIELRPRIDYFVIASIAILQLINISAFAYLLRRTPSYANPILAAFFWMLPFYAPDSPVRYLLLLPDYLSVEPAIAMLSTGLLLKAYEPADWRLRHYVGLGALLGIALATKITLCIMPGVVLLYLALTAPLRTRSVVNAGVAASIGLIIWILIVFVDLHFDWSQVERQFWELARFIRYGGGMPAPQHSWIVWLWMRAQSESLASACIYLSPAFAIAVLVLARDRKRLFLFGSLLIGALMCSFVLYKRDYIVTLIESTFYSFMLFFIAWHVILRSAAANWWSGVPSVARAPARAIAVCFLLILTVTYTRTYIAASLSMIIRTTEVERQLERIKREVGGRQLWLVPDNDARPFSIDSAIMKGGSGSTGIWLEPDSALMRSIAPDLVFRFEINDKRPVRLADYSAVFFMTRGSVDSRLKLLNTRYGIDLTALDCRTMLTMETGTLVMCTSKAGRS